jgi:hypothetical protein
MADYLGLIELLSVAWNYDGYSRFRPGPRVGFGNDKLHVSHFCMCRYFLPHPCTCSNCSLLFCSALRFGQPLEAIQRRARTDHTSVSWYLSDANPGMAGNYAQAKSAAIVFISADSGEGSFPVDGNAGDR